MASSPETENNWKFAQCFGDKGESDDITEGISCMISFSETYTNPYYNKKKS
jgi:serine/threonine-protein phosphatase 2A regulatory subunit B